MMIALYIIGGIIVLILVLALVAPKEFKMHRSVIVNRSKQEGVDYIKALKKQGEWAVWQKMDPNIKNEYRGIDGTVGFVSAWEGNNKVGKGEQEIKSIREGERVGYDLRFEKPFKARNDAYIELETVGNNQTKITWGFFGKTVFPMNIFYLFVNMDKMIGKDYETGLANLKAILEKQ